MSRSGSSKADPVATRRSSRRSSLVSPGRVGRLSTLVQQYKDGNMDSFTSSPGRSILSDNTDIEQPRRQSWWKRLDDNNSRDMIEALRNERVDEGNNVLEDLDVEILSQEKERRNFSLDLPDSSGSETIDSIIIPERKLFNQKESLPQKKFSNLFGPRESMVKLYKQNTEKIKDITTMVGPKKLFGQAPRDRHKIFETVTTSPIKSSQEDSVVPPKKLFTQDNPQRKTIFPDVINSSPKKSDDIFEPEAGPKNLFPQNTKERKTIFPSALLDTSPDKTANKTTEVRKEVQGQVRSLFGNRPTTKRKNMFADFIVVESEDEVPDIQPRMFGFGKKPEVKRRGSSSSHALTDAEDDWKMLPSSTMMEHMEGLSSPVKRPKLSTIPRERESGGALSDEEIVPTNKEAQNKIRNKNKSLSHLSVHKNATITACTEVTPNKSLPIEFVKNDSEAENVIQQIANITKHTENLIQNKTQTINKTLNKSEVLEPVEPINMKPSESKDKTREEVSENVFDNQEIDISNKEATSKSDTRKSKTFIINHSNTSNNKGEDSTETAQEEAKNISNESEPEDIMKLTYDEEELEENERASPINGPLAVIAEASNERDPESLEISNNKNKRTVEDSNDENTTPNPILENVEENKKEDTADIVFDDMINDIADPNVEKVHEHKNVEHSHQLINDQAMETDNIHEDDNEKQQNQEPVHQEEVKVNKKTSESMVIDKQIIQQEDDVKETEIENEIATEQEAPDDQEQNSRTEGAYIENNQEEPSIHEVSEDKNVDQADESDEQSIQDDEESQEIEEELEASEAEESEVNVDPINESDNENNEQNESESDNENVVEDAEVENQEFDNEVIPESPNVTHDTTGRNRNKNQTNVKSPEAILHDKTNINDSFGLKERRTSIRKTKSLIHSPKIRDSLDSNKNSSAEGSGWDSHRTTRKTIRQTFGKDFTPRKSLRALVMEKSAKRQTENPIRESVGYPQANSTEIVQNFTVPQEMAVVNETVDNTADNYQNTVDNDHDTADNVHDTAENYNDTGENDDEAADNDYDIADNDQDTADNDNYTADVEYSALESPAPKTPDVSVRTRQTTLEMYLENIRRDIVERKRNSEAAVKKLLTAPKRDMSDFYRASIKRIPRSTIGTKPRVSKTKTSAIPLDRIPEEILKDMKYKPPKRFMKNDASWITKRLYKYLETKLEPKYDFKARVKAEKLVENIYLFTKYIQKLEQAPQDSIDELKIIMARLNIVTTHHDFYEFFYDYMPREVRIKVVPNITNKLPMPKHGVFNEIIRAGG